MNAAVIINADDWGRDKDVTDRSFECVSQGVLSSVSAMVLHGRLGASRPYWRDSMVWTAGLHLNLTTVFSGANCGPRLKSISRKSPASCELHVCAPRFIIRGHFRLL